MIRLPVGWQRRLARKLGVTDGAISRVIRGGLTSRRLSAAIDREVRRLEKIEMRRNHNGVDGR